MIWNQLLHRRIASDTKTAGLVTASEYFATICGQVLDIINSTKRPHRPNWQQKSPPELSSFPRQSTFQYFSYSDVPKQNGWPKEFLSHLPFSIRGQNAWCTQFAPFTSTSWYPADLADVRECKHPLQFGAKHLSPHGQKRRVGICKVSRYERRHWMPLGIRYCSISLHPCILFFELRLQENVDCAKLGDHEMFLWHAWGLHLLMATPPAGHIGDLRPDLTRWKFLLWFAAAANAPKPTGGKMNTDAGCRLPVFLPDSEWTPTCLSKAIGLL